MTTRREGLGVMGAGMVAAAADTLAAAPAGSGAPVGRFVYEAQVDIAPTEDLGAGPLGRRRIVPILGGSFVGPYIRGRVRAGGADRQLLRPDGILQLHALYEMETDDGAILTVSNRALIDAPPAGPRYAASTVEITAPEGRHAWLNRRIFVGTVATMEPARRAVRIRVFAME